MSNSSMGKRLVPSRIIRQYAAGDIALIRSRYQSYTGGSDIYDKKCITGEPKFDEVFHHVWKIFFTPSKPVSEIISKELNRMNLVPGHYVSAHLRALYATDSRSEAQTQDWARNALNCASTLRPGLPIFFASDSDEALNYSETYGKMKKAQVAFRIPSPNPPLHLDATRDWQTRPPSDFYDTFVDLYLLALGGCVHYGLGGFGHWGLLIGGNVTCAMQIKFEGHKQFARITNQCSWTSRTVATGVLPHWDKHPLFSERM